MISDHAQTYILLPTLTGDFDPGCEGRYFAATAGINKEDHAGKQRRLRVYHEQTSNNSTSWNYIRGPAVDWVSAYRVIDESCESPRRDVDWVSAYRVNEIPRWTGDLYLTSMLSRDAQFNNKLDQQSAQNCVHVKYERLMQAEWKGGSHSDLPADVVKGLHGEL